MILFILLAMLGGITIVVARIINFNLAGKIGLVQGTFINYVTGFLGSVLLLFIVGEQFGLFNQAGVTVPWWAFAGGFLGVLVVSISSILTPKMSAFTLTLFMFIGQIFSGIVVDYLMFNTVSLGKIIGGVLVLFGLTLNLFIDKKAIEQTKATS